MRAWASGIVLVGCLLAAPGAQAQDSLCLTAPVPVNASPPTPLRFGITPLLAGSAGSSQGEVFPEDRGKAQAALTDLQPPGRRLVMRLNRIFESEGATGIARAVALAAEYAAAGFDVESQVRYHPSPEQDGDIDAWEAYVRAFVQGLAPNRAVIALTITNEVNLPLSSNTSDGAFKRPLDAIVRGTVAAREELDRLGRGDVQLGFSYAYRYLPDQDVAFWRGIGERATPAFLAATEYVGVQIYPGLFYPPALKPGQSAGDATIDALALIRGCYMPLSRLGADVGIWITENGYPTNLNRSEERQDRDLRTTVEAVHAYSGTLGVTDYRYFNLRDNRPKAVTSSTTSGCCGRTTRARRRSRPIGTSSTDSASSHRPVRAPCGCACPTGGRVSATARCARPSTVPPLRHGLLTRGRRRPLALLESSPGPSRAEPDAADHARTDGDDATARSLVRAARAVRTLGRVVRR